MAKLLPRLGLCQIIKQASTILYHNEIQQTSRRYDKQRKQIMERSEVDMHEVQLA